MGGEGSSIIPKGLDGLNVQFEASYWGLSPSVGTPEA